MILATVSPLAQQQGTMVTSLEQMRQLYSGFSFQFQSDR